MNTAAALLSTVKNRWQTLTTLGLIGGIAVAGMAVFAAALVVDLSSRLF